MVFPTLGTKIIQQRVKLVPNVRRFSRIVEVETEVNRSPPSKEKYSAEERPPAVPLNVGSYPFTLALLPT